MLGNGRLKAFSGGVGLYGPTALAVTERQGNARAPKRRGPPQRAAFAGQPSWGESAKHRAESPPPIAGRVDGGEREGADAASALASQAAAGAPMFGPGFEEAAEERARRLVEHLRRADIKLPSGLPGDGQVLNEDNALLFVARHARMVVERGPELATPRVAYHWTSEANFESIAKSNLRVPDGGDVKKKHGAAFGRGIYMSPDFRFAKEDFSYGASATFMCLVLTGAQQSRQHRSQANLFDLPACFDSVIGRLPGRPCDTWVLQTSEQVLPCFLVDELAARPVLAALRGAIALLMEPWPPGTLQAAESDGRYLCAAAPEVAELLGGELSTAAPATQPGAHAGASAPTASYEAPVALPCAARPAVAATPPCVVPQEAPQAVADAASGSSRRWRGRRGQDESRAAPPAPCCQAAAVGSTAPPPRSTPDAEAASAGRVGASSSRRRWSAAADDRSAGGQPPASGDVRLPEAVLKEVASVVTIAGDILGFSEQFLVHQCCCVLSKPAAGVAAAVFERFPGADIYRQRRERGRPVDEPGSVSVHGRVVNLYGQFCPGRPLESRAQAHRSAYAECLVRFPDVADTREQRLQWFRQGLEAVADLLPDAAHERTLALPARIGCGLAAGHWPEYISAIVEMSVRRHVVVAIYDIEAAPGARSAATGQLARRPGEPLVAPPAPQRAAGAPRRQRSFWENSVFEFATSRGGAWAPFSADDQRALAEALRGPPPPGGQRRKPAVLADGREVDLDGIELGLGKMLPGPGSRGAGDVAVRLSLGDAVSEPGELHLPEDLEDAPPPALADCGRCLLAQEVLERMADRCEAEGRSGGGIEAASCCAVCFCDWTEDLDMQAFELRCGHAFHEACLSRWFRERPECPTCKQRFGVVTGAQPREGSFSWVVEAASLPGHGDCGTIALTVRFPPGSDEQGVHYSGRQERAFLPDDAAGRSLLAVMKAAFRRRLLFGLGISMKLGIRRPTFNVHLKTSRTGGVTRHGFPDKEYAQRTFEEMRLNGLGIEDLA